MGTQSKRSLPVLLLCAALLLACGQKVDKDSLVIPRGSTLAVRNVDAIMSGRSAEGDTFKAQLESPLSRNRVMYVNAGTPIDGVIEKLEEDASGQYRAVLRLTRMELPEGKSVEIRTSRLDRDARDTPASVQEVSATTGIESLIHRLAETRSAASLTADSSDNNAGMVVVAADSPMVFTLDADLVIPMPESPILVPLPSSPERRVDGVQQHTLTMSTDGSTVDTIQGPDGKSSGDLTPLAESPAP